ncbi:MAG: hypothetical protein C4309_09885, partial [Chloroflexota bacterium]
YGLARTIANVLAGRVVAPHQHGLAFGLVETIISLSYVGVSYLAGQLYTRNPEWPFLVTLALLPLTMGLSWFLAPRPARAQVPEAALGAGAPVERPLE